MVQSSLESLFGAREEVPATDGLSTLALRAIAARAEADLAEERAKAARRDADEAEGLLLDAMSQANLKSVRLESGQLLTSSFKTSYRLPPKKEPELRARALAWISANGGTEIIGTDVHPQSLQAFLRELARAEKDVPEELFSRYEQKILSVRKG